MRKIGCTFLACNLGIAVDDDFTEVGQQFRCPILARAPMKKFRRFVEKLGSDAAFEEAWVGDEVEKEWDVGFDAAHAEFLKAAFHAPGRVEEANALGRHLHEKRVEERRND